MNPQFSRRRSEARGEHRVLFGVRVADIRIPGGEYLAAEGGRADVVQLAERAGATAARRREAPAANDVARLKRVPDNL